MRALMMVLAMILITAPAVFAQGTAACPTATTTISTGCDMVDMCMMRCFQVSKQQLTALRNQGWTDADIAMAAAISQKANVSVSQVAADYKANPNWQAVASKYNLTMSDLMAIPTVTASQDEETFNQMFASRYYNVPMSDISQLRQQGYSWESIYMLANAAAQTRQPVMTIANLRSQGMSWSDIASRYNVPVANLTSPTRMTVAVTPTTTMVVGAGPTPTMSRYVYGSNGGIILTESEAMRYYSQGYDWTEVAIAANVSRQTGMPIEEILPRFRTGTTVADLIWETGVNPCDALNFSAFPFQHVSIYSEGTQQKMMKRYCCILRDCGLSDEVTQQYCPAPCPAPEPVCPPPCP